MSWFITNLIATLLLPPLSLLLLLGTGSLLQFSRFRKLAKWISLTAFSLIWLSSTPIVAEGGLHLLEAQIAPLDKLDQKAEAIVILGGGTYFHAPEYAGQNTVGEPTLMRLRYGAKLQRESGKPILVTGGKPLGNELSEAHQMRTTLEQEFHVPVSWAEEASENTFENAYYSYRILEKAGIRRIYLVTHAWHMPRAAEIFRRAGFEVIEAPTGFTTRYQIDLLAFLPQAEAMTDSKIFVHEAIGLVWYRLKLAFSVGKKGQELT